MNAPVDGFTWPTEPPKLVPPIVVGLPLKYSVPAGPFQTALDRQIPCPPPGALETLLGLNAYPIRRYAIDERPRRHDDE